MKKVKKGIAFILAVLMIITIIPTDQINQVFASETDGAWDGESVQEPEILGYEYQIDSATELAWLAQEVNNGNTFDGKVIYITGDIDLNNQEWFVIGKGTADKPFEIDADIIIQNATIQGLKISDSQVAVKGLFGAVRVGNMSIDNLKLESVDISGTSQNYDGFLFGSVEMKRNSELEISNCKFSGEVAGNSHCGAVAGNVEAINRNATMKITNCDLTISSTSYGTWWDGKKRNSSFKGGMIGRYNSEANTKLILNGIKCNVDLAGYNEEGYDSACVGGMIGVLIGTAKVYVYQCAVTGKIISSGYAGWAGGIVGNMNGCDTYKQSDCYVTTSISSSWNAYGYPYNAGGFLEGPYVQKSKGYIKNSYFAGDSGSAVGFIAKDYSSNENGFKIYNSYYDSDKVRNHEFHTDGHCYVISGTTVNCKAYTTEQMAEQNNYEDWDFDNVWIMKDGYPELRMNDFTLPEDFRENESWNIAESEIVKIVKDYASQEYYDQWSMIYNSDLPDTAKYEKILALASNYGVTDPKEGLEYVIKSNNKRWAYKELTTDDLFVASQFLDWLNKDGHRLLLDLDGLFFNGEINDYVDIGTYITSDYPGVSKYKDLLYKYMDEASANLEMWDDIKLVSELCKNVTDTAEKLYVDECISKLSKLTQASDSEKREQIINKLVTQDVKVNTGVGESATDLKFTYELDKKSGFGQFAKGMGLATKTIKCVDLGIHDIYDLNHLDSKLHAYYQFETFLNDIIEAKGIVPNELRAAAQQALMEIKSGYKDKFFDIGIQIIQQTKLSENTLKKILGEVKANSISSFIAAINIESWFINQVADIGEAVKNAAYVEGYAYLARLYKVRLENSTEKFLNNMTDENAWSFYYDYNMLYSLRYKGEEMYLKMCNLDGICGKLLSIGYDVKEEAVNQTLSLLKNTCKFDLSETVDVPESLKYLSKIIIGCPVDIKVINNSGEVIAELKDGEIQDVSNKYGRFVVVYDYYTGDYKKIAYLLDESVQIEINANDDGLVDLQYAYKDGSDNIIIKGISSTPLLEEQKIQVIPDIVKQEGTVNLISNSGTKECQLVKEDNESKKTSVVHLTEGNIELIAGKSKLLTVMSEPENIAIDNIVWTSSDTEIVTVKNGNVKAHKEGSAKVYAFIGEKFMVCDVKVSEKKEDKTEKTDNGTTSGNNSSSSISGGGNNNVPSINGNTDDKNDEGIDSGKQDEQKPEIPNEQDDIKYKIDIASKRLAVGTKVKLSIATKENTVDNTTVRWSSSNSKYATVSKRGVVCCKTKGIGKSVTITAKSADGTKELASVTFKIMKNAVTTVQIKKAPKTMGIGESVKLKAIVTATGKSANTTLKWTSSNTKYATVNKNGKVIAKKAGKGKYVVITAASTDGSNKKASVRIKIK